MKVGDLVIHNTVQYSAIVKKLFKNGNAILQLIPTEKTLKEFERVDEGDCVKVKDLKTWFSYQACSSCEYMNKKGMCWARKDFAEYGKNGCDYRAMANEA